MSFNELKPLVRAVCEISLAAAEWMVGYLMDDPDRVPEYIDAIEHERTCDYCIRKLDGEMPEYDEFDGDPDNHGYDEPEEEDEFEDDFEDLGYDEPNEEED